MNVLGLLIVAFGALILWIATRPHWKRPSEQTLLSLTSSEADHTQGRPGPALPQPADGLGGDGAEDLRRRSTKQ